MACCPILYKSKYIYIHNIRTIYTYLDLPKGADGTNPAPVVR